MHVFAMAGELPSVRYGFLDPGNGKRAGGWVNKQWGWEPPLVPR